MTVDITPPDIQQAVKPIAIVLPQFHPIPENNAWWGNGFTEWTNVVKGQPRFPGHYQPHLPKDLGFYDMRLHETRVAQAELARSYGIHGFCYYHYWFNERRLLEQPVDRMLQISEPDFPFMLCWANENWTRNWDGGFKKILLEQHYSTQDFVLHARHLVKYFRDSRYIRIKEKPVFAIYKDEGIGHIEECLTAFREELWQHKIEVFLCRFERRAGTRPNRSEAYSLFDAGIEFQPLTARLNLLIERADAKQQSQFGWDRNLNRIRRLIGRATKPLDTVVSYAEMVENDLQYDFQGNWPIFPGATPGWDNSSRRQKIPALIFRDSDPEVFGSWVERKVKATNWDNLPERFIFINAWNEWAEGNHLEPCEKWGTAYLDALKKAIVRPTATAPRPHL